MIQGEGLGLVTQSSYERKRPRRVSLNTHNPPREARTAAVSRYADRHTDTLTACELHPTSQLE